MGGRSGRRSLALSPRRALFAREYIVDLNATQAAKRAGYSDKSARTDGPRMLHNAVVQAEIHKLVKTQHAQVDLTAEKVIGALCEIGFANIDLRDVKPADKIQSLKILA